MSPVTLFTHSKPLQRGTQSNKEIDNCFKKNTTGLMKIHHSLIQIFILFYINHILNLIFGPLSKNESYPKEFNC